MSTRNVKENLADHLAIQDLISRFSLGVNLRDFAMLADVFAEDGVWDVQGPVPHKHEGRAAVVEALRERITGNKLVVQTPHASVIEVQGDRATTRVTIHEFVQMEGGPKGFMMMGTYHDEALREHDGEWRFKCRRFVYSYADMVTPAPGAAYLSFADQKG